MTKNYARGVFYALLSAAAISVTLVASKQALREVSPLLFSPMWFGVASIWGGLLYVRRYGWQWEPSLSENVRPILLMGGLNGLANILLFWAISIGDPTLVSFFSRSATIYIVLLGAFFLSERLRSYQWLGVAIAIVGAGVMTFQSGLLVWQILGIMLVSNFFLALSQMIAKLSVEAVPPLVLSTARTVIMTVFLGAIALAFEPIIFPSLETWLWTIGGAFFGPFLSYILFYHALRDIELSRAGVIRATQPIFVAGYSLILFGTTVTLNQFVGGLVMLVGVVLMLWEQQESNA